MWVNKIISWLVFKNNNKSKEYKVEAIFNSTFYFKISENGHFPDLYYLILYKKFFQEENTWKPVFAIQHLSKFVNNFHKYYPKKFIVIFPLIYLILLTARLTVRLEA